MLFFGDHAVSVHGELRVRGQLRGNTERPGEGQDLGLGSELMQLSLFVAVFVVVVVVRVGGQEAGRNRWSVRICQRYDQSRH